MKKVIYSEGNVSGQALEGDEYIFTDSRNLLDLSVEEQFFNVDLVIFHAIFAYSTESNYRRLLANFFVFGTSGTVEIIVSERHQQLPMLYRSFRAVGMERFLSTSISNGELSIKFPRGVVSLSESSSCYFPLETYIETSNINHFLNDLEYAIEALLPFSLIRIGHCEVKFLSFGYMFGDSDLKQTYQLQWGVNEVDDEFYQFVRSGLINAINNGIYLGFNLRTKICSEPLKILENCVHKSLSDLSLIKSKHKRVPPNFHFSIGASVDFIQLLKKARKIVLVTSRASLLDKFKSIFSTSKVDLILLPGEYRVDGAYSIEHRVSRFLEVDTFISKSAVPGMVFIIGGGVAGKHFCATAVNKGAIALDLGSVLDAWSGVESRGTGFNVEIKHSLDKYLELRFK